MKRRINAALWDSGGHPFILVCRVNPNNDSVLVCLTQNDVPQFVRALEESTEFRTHLFWKGFSKALTVEPYDAAEFFFKWILEGDPASDVDVLVYNEPISHSRIMLVTPFSSANPNLRMVSLLNRPAVRIGLP